MRNAEPSEAELREILALHSVKQFADAEAVALKLIKKFRRSAYLHNLLGILQAEQNRQNEAVTSYQRALKFNPQFPEAHNNLGNALQHLREFDNAAENYRRAIALNSDYAKAHNNLGNTLRQLGEHENAVNCFRRALEIDPSYANAHSNLGVSLQEMGWVEDSIQSYQAALDINPQFLPARVNISSALNELDQPEEAARYARQVIQLNPNIPEAHNNLAVALSELDQCDDAVKSFRQALRLNPDYHEALQNFAANLDGVSNLEVDDIVIDLIVRCLEKSTIDSPALHSVSQSILMHELLENSDLDKLNINAVFKLKLSIRSLLASYLKNCFVADVNLERVFSALRSELLNADKKKISEKQSEDALIGLQRALSYQSFRNEYLWSATYDESELVKELEASVLHAVERNSEIEEFDLYRLGSYKPLYQINDLVNWAKGAVRDASGPKHDAIQTLVLDHSLESDIAAKLTAVTPIDDEVSQVVQSQYDENPYPRWDSVPITRPHYYSQVILREIAPNRPQLLSTAENPSVLIAGCGTGKHAITSALRYHKSNVLAIDLSRVSLAFAVRKANEMQISNLKFAQGDVLNLDGIDKQFDIIECSGVLHHMRDPEAGLTSLLKVLKPHGLLKLGVYSQRAREFIGRLRELFADKEFDLSLEGVQSFRKILLQDQDPDLRVIQKIEDFYSTSTFRDMIFDYHEHCFTPLQVETLLENFDLDFLGFVFSDKKTKAVYANEFPDDPNCISLENWDSFERARPITFTNMLQFWCRKTA